MRWNPPFSWFFPRSLMIYVPLFCWLNHSVTEWFKPHVCHCSLPIHTGEIPVWNSCTSCIHHVLDIQIVSTSQIPMFCSGSNHFAACLLEHRAEAFGRKARNDPGHQRSWYSQWWCCSCQTQAMCQHFLVPRDERWTPKDHAAPTCWLSWELVISKFLCFKPFWESGHKLSGSLYICSMMFFLTKGTLAGTRGLFHFTKTYPLVN